MTTRIEAKPAGRDHNLKNKLKGIGAVGTSMLLMGTLAAAAKANSAPKTTDKNVPVQIADLKSKLAADHDQIVSDKLQISRLSTLLSRLEGMNRIKKADILGTNLKHLRDLPGFGEKISQDRQEQLAKSTVHIIFRPSGSEGEWVDNCSATKALYGETEYVVANKHCFGNVINNSDTTGSQGQQAHNYMPASDYEYAISYGKDIHTPVAAVTGMSLSENSDWALLQVNPTNTTSGQVSWDNIPALNYNSAPKQPIPGEQVALYGYSWMNGFQPEAGTGIFLGEEVHGSNPTGDTNSVPVVSYYVGISPYTMLRDRCNYGDSASSFISKSGFVSGGLAVRNNIGYSNGLPNFIQNMVEKPDIPGRIKIEKNLGLDLSSFPTICKFNGRVTSPNPNFDTMAGLVKGFDYPVSKIEGGFGHN